MFHSKIKRVKLLAINYDSKVKLLMRTSCTHDISKSFVLLLKLLNLIVEIKNLVSVFLVL